MMKVVELVRGRPPQTAVSEPEAQLSPLERLRQLREEHANKLVGDGVIERIIELGLLDEPGRDDFYLVRRCTGKEYSRPDSRFALTPSMAELLEVFESNINHQAKVVQLQHLQPMESLEQYDPYAHVASLGLTLCVCFDSKAVQRQDVRGVEPYDMAVIENCLTELETAVDLRQIAIPRQQLVAPEPLGWVRPGIPLV